LPGRERSATRREATLERQGPPPYDRLLVDYPVIVGAERALYPYPEFDGRTEMTSAIWLPEYGLIEQVNALRGLADTYVRLYPQIQLIDLRREVLRLEVPLTVVMGRHEAAGRVRPAREWFDALEAPSKCWVVLEGSSHRANVERPAEYARLLAEIVAATADRPSPADQRAAGGAVELRTAAQLPIEAIERHIVDGLVANAIPGATIGVVAADGTVHLRGFETTGRRGEPITPQTPFLIGSVTKSITALAVLQRVDRGAVDLDAPVARYLPWFEVEPTDLTARVTVRTLLHHTSGLPASAGGPAGAWMLDLPVMEVARAVRGTTLARQPGEAWEYTNANYVLLGAILEAVTGRSYEQVLQENVFDPLGMVRTFIAVDTARAAGMSEGHRYWFGRTVPHFSHREGMVPAGLLLSTAEDLSRYLRMILNGGELDGRRLLTAEALYFIFIR
jgi:CubicO group peptidase (beta-lactamase class C family)